MWRSFWARAPRQLRFTRAGRIIVGVALAAGLAAMNTGNNLLFLGWGMVLSAIVVSGVLSEATLRMIAGSARLPTEVRVGQRARLPLRLYNASHRLPAYAVEVVAEMRMLGAETHLDAAAPYLLRLGPRAEVGVEAQFEPRARGRCQLLQLVVRTTYPFGFFEKSRRLDPAALGFWCLPRAVPVGHLVRSLVARMGSAPAGTAGPGDEFFALRPYRSGDDVRRVAWRRVVRQDRWVVRETETQHGQELCLELHLLPRIAPAAAEHAIAVLGSIAEALLARGYRVGVLAPGLSLAAAGGPRQRWELLLALAQLEWRAAMPRGRRVRALRVALAGEGALAPADSDLILPVPPAEPRAA